MEVRASGRGVYDPPPLPRRAYRKWSHSDVIGAQILTPFDEQEAKHHGSDLLGGSFPEFSKLYAKPSVFFLEIHWIRNVELEDEIEFGIRASVCDLTENRLLHLQPALKRSKINQ